MERSAKWLSDGQSNFVQQEPFQLGRVSPLFVPLLCIPLGTIHRKIGKHRRKDSHDTKCCRYWLKPELQEFREYHPLRARIKVLEQPRPIEGSREIALVHRGYVSSLHEGERHDGDAHGGAPIA